MKSNTSDPHRHILSAVLVLSLVAPGAASAQSGQGASGADADSGSPSGGSASELFFTVEELREEVRRLRGSIEEVSHRVEQLNRRSRERYVDLDQRLVDLNSRVAELEDSAGATDSGSSGENSGSNGDASGSNAAQSNSGGDYRKPDEAEREAYASIQYLIQEKKDYDAAIDKLYEFIDEYPEGDLTVNAYYWLGELYLSQGSYEQARQAFSIVTSRHENHRKASDALFKLAVAHDRAGNSDKAKEILERLSERYPDSRSAALGKEYRAEMKQESGS